RKMPSRCIFFFSARSAWSTLLSRTDTCTWFDAPLTRVDLLVGKNRWPMDLGQPRNSTTPLACTVRDKEALLHPRPANPRNRADGHTEDRPDGSPCPADAGGT